MVLKLFFRIWRVLEDVQDSSQTTFSLWGYQLYHDSWTSGAYEVNYYKGNAKEVYHLLKGINDFSEKYRNEDKVLTFINNVQIKR